MFGVILSYFVFSYFSLVCMDGMGGRVLGAVGERWRGGAKSDASTLAPLVSSTGQLVILHSTIVNLTYQNSPN